MLKLVGIVLVIGSFTGIGMAQHQQYQGRVRALRDLLSALDIMDGELAYRLSSLPDIVQLLAHSPSAAVSRVFSYIHTALEKDDGLSLTYKWMKGFQQVGPEIGLRPDDVLIFCDLSDFIGKYDVCSQQKCVAYAHKRLEGQLKLAEAECKSKGTVYRTCCIAAGLLLVLVLI